VNGLGRPLATQALFDGRLLRELGSSKQGMSLKLWQTAELMAGERRNCVKLARKGALFCSRALFEDEQKGRRTLPGRGRKVPGSRCHGYRLSCTSSLGTGRKMLADHGQTGGGCCRPSTRSQSAYETSERTMAIGSSAEVRASVVFRWCFGPGSGPSGLDVLPNDMCCLRLCPLLERRDPMNRQMHVER
jgi:hypothetical protein